MRQEVNPRVDRIIVAIARAVALRVPEPRVLHLGCGDGHYAKLLSPFFDVQVAVEPRVENWTRYGLRTLFDELLITEIADVPMGDIEGFSLTILSQPMQVMSDRNHDIIKRIKCACSVGLMTSLYVSPWFPELTEVYSDHDGTGCYVIWP